MTQVGTFCYKIFGAQIVNASSCGIMEGVLIMGAPPREDYGNIVPEEFNRDPRMGPQYEVFPSRLTGTSGTPFVPNPHSTPSTHGATCS